MQGGSDFIETKERKSFDYKTLIYSFNAYILEQVFQLRTPWDIDAAQRIKNDSRSIHLYCL